MGYQEIEAQLNWKTQIFPKQHDKRGFKLLEEITIECPNCHIPLLNIIKVAQGEKYKVQVQCPKCLSDSFIKSISGKLYIHGADNTSIESADLDNNVYKIKVSLNG